MLHKYETVIIFDPTSKEIVKAEMNKFKDVINGFGKLTEFNDLGEKKLAYEIKSHKSAYYAIYYFMTKPDNIAELERQLRIDDHVLKFMTVRVDDDDLDEYAEPTEEELEEAKSPAEILSGSTVSEQDVAPKEIDVFDLIFGEVK